MAREVEWAQSASDDLAEIAAYIARASRSLRTLSERGRVVPEYRDPSIRELLVRSYRLVYQLDEHSAQVLRIIHAARPQPTRAS